MKFIKNILFLFYNYYNKGATKEIPYISAVAAFVFLIVLNLILILGMLFPTEIFNYISLQVKFHKNNKLQSYLFGIGIFLLIYLFFRLVIPEKDLKEANYSVKKWHNWVLVVYIIFSFFTLITYAIYRKNI